MFSDDFRKGFDAASAMSAMQQIFSIEEKTQSSAIAYISIHKDNFSFINGLIIENLFLLEVKDPPDPSLNSSLTEENVWIKIYSNKACQK